MSTDEAVHTDVVRALPPAAVGLMEMSADDFARFKGIATALAQSQAFKDADSAPIAFAKMVVGRELGLGVAQSMMGLHLVEGSVQMHYSTMLACVRGRGWKYRIPDHTEEKCVIEWVDPDGVHVGTTEYTMADAERQGLFQTDANGKRVTKHNKASMYEKVPKNMLLARCVSNGVKEWVPEALGGMPVYVTGEIERERYVDGSAEEVEGARVSLSAVAEDIPAKLRDRFYAAYGEASHLLPGRYTPAGIQMSVRGATPEETAERAEAYLTEMEATVAQAQAEQPPDVDVVEEEDGPVRATNHSQAEVERLAREMDEASDGGAGQGTDAPAATDSPAVQDLEPLMRQLSDLQDQRVAVEENPGEHAETEAELARLDREIDAVEARIVGAGGVVPGQESLGL